MLARLRQWLREWNRDISTNEELIRNPQVLSLYREIVESYNKYFNHVEQIKKFELLPVEWSVETGELTPKLNFKRKVILEKYKPYIDKIYS